MRVFIKDLQTGLFMNAASEWAANEEAYVFRSPTFAVDLCVMRRLRKVRIILDLGDPTEDIFLDVYGAEQVGPPAGLRESERLQKQQRDLVDRVRTARAALAASKAALPLRRKKKREKPPEQI
jgi:hypothetical protein